MIMHVHVLLLYIIFNYKTCTRLGRKATTNQHQLGLHQVTQVTVIVYTIRTCACMHVVLSSTRLALIAQTLSGDIS